MSSNETGIPDTPEIQLPTRYAIRLKIPNTNLRDANVYPPILDPCLRSIQLRQLHQHHLLHRHHYRQ